MSTFRNVFGVDGATSQCVDCGALVGSAAEIIDHTCRPVGKYAPSGAGRYDATVGEWGSLPQEPCRYCRQVGGVRFFLGGGSEGRNTDEQPVHCDKCGRSWESGSALA